MKKFSFTSLDMLAGECLIKGNSPRYIQHMNWTGDKKT